MKDVVRALPQDGKARHLFREFNKSRGREGKLASVGDLLTSLGFEVDHRQLPRGMSGRLVQEAFADNGFRIELNISHSVPARRFTGLHEAAHFFLHTDHSDFFHDPQAFDLSGSTFYENLAHEREANEFAETVFFGDGALEAAVTVHGTDTAILSKHFGLTEKCVSVALTRRMRRR